MIRFDLTCTNDHSFDSWFRSGADCDKLIASKMVACTTCGDNDVLKKHVEATATDVGDKFSTEARAMHDGDKPERPIYGQASAAETKQLLSDGVPILPLPFMPTKKTN